MAAAVSGSSKAGNALKYVSIVRGCFPVNRRTASVVCSNSPAAMASNHPDFSSFFQDSDSRRIAGASTYRQAPGNIANVIDSGPVTT
ncbi:MAG TPA: hypothetical protein VK789_11615 [Bryobacteraceae bacterium]|nr:hypothetical protein [Bryobacteraceae bacterium]